MKLARKWILVATLLLSMVVATTGTLAYLTDTDTRTNVFTMGKVDISILEPNVDNKLTPGATANKDAEIKNDGDTDAYVWMTVVLDENLDKLVDLIWNGYTPEKTVENGEAIYLVKYPEVLAAGDSTDKILDAVSMKGNVDVQGDKLVLIENGQIVATYEGARDNLQVTVNAYAVQADGMNGVDDAYNKYYAQWGENGGGTSGEGDEGDSILVSTKEDLLAALENGGKIKLGDNIDLGSAGAIVSKDTTINLNGHTISASCGEADIDSDNGATKAVLYVSGADLVIEGEGSVTNTAADRAVYCVMVDNKANVTIKGGNYVTYHDAVYVRDGKLVIEGGFFQATSDTKPEADYIHPNYPDEPASFSAHVINCYKDAYINARSGSNYSGGVTAEVAISGGTFVNENPSNIFEGWYINENWVLEGYTVSQAEQANGDIWYTVSAD